MTTTHVPTLYYCKIENQNQYIALREVAKALGYDIYTTPSDNATWKYFAYRFSSDKWGISDDKPNYPNKTQREVENHQELIKCMMGKAFMLKPKLKKWTVGCAAIYWHGDCLYIEHGEDLFALTKEKIKEIWEEGKRLGIVND
jgi:hypothetical protein